jgi:hypothetical protein
VIARSDPALAFGLASWSPDGTSLIFTCGLATIVGDLNYEVCRIPAGGGVAVNLTRLAAPDMRATWFRE